MKWRDVMKGVVIGIFIATLALSLGRCTQAVEAKDWKECDTKIMLLNTTNKALLYNVYWVDHNIPVFRGRTLPRCGGKLQAHKSNTPSKKFRLCLGRHIVTWHGLRTGEVVAKYMFTLKAGTSKLIITPKGVIPVNAAEMPAPEVKLKPIAKWPLIKPEVVGPAGKIIQTAASVKDIQQGLLKEEAIKQSLEDNYKAFIRVAKTTRSGRSVVLHTSITDNNLLYTMSVRGTPRGITSIDFTVQNTIGKDVINIYYEGVRSNGYYCYAKQLFKAENCKQLAITKKSIFEQVVVMLFEGGEVI
ncbi:hypothetical protein KAR91_65470 [Candidatus Pacearchaeota archaeon]|nr:hypothetical protein [Candidatus Pacearchaeota archaeon]